VLVTKHLREQHGSVLVLTAVFLPVALIFGAFVIDVGNWFVHKRHLQVQADAAALAASSGFRFPCDANANATIRAIADTYGGGTYNLKLKQTDAANRHQLVNEPTYYNQSKPPDADLTGSPEPCAAGFVDVKMTETNLPWFFDKSRLVNFINAQARVNVKQVAGSKKTMPISAIEPDPKTVKATLFDAGGNQIGTANLNSCTSSGGSKVCDSSSNPLTVTMDNSANSGQFDYSHMTARITLSGSTSTTCTDLLVSCYDNLLWVRGYSDQPTLTGTNNMPRLRGMPLINTTCSDAYFTDGTACTVTLKAFIDFQAGLNLATDVAVKAHVNGTTVTLAHPTVSEPAWTATISIPAAAGTVPISIDWEQQKLTITHSGTTVTCNNKQPGTGNNKNPCFGSFGTPSNDGFQTSPGAGPTLQQPFSALNTDTGSGPLTSVQIGHIDSGTGLYTSDENNLPRCSTTVTSCTHNFVFKVAIKGVLALSQPADPPVALRVVGNQTQTVNCDPNVSNLRLELELPTSPTDTTHGCHRTFTANPGTACPSSNPALWALPDPLNCVAVSTGGSSGQLIQGLNMRFEGNEDGKKTTCINPNRWDATANPVYPVTDPRIVAVFVTPYGTFQSTGQGPVPVLGLAYFYVTGWTGTNGNPNPCALTGNPNDNVIAPGSVGDQTVVSGHFIKYVDPTGIPDPTIGCNLNDPNNVFGCVAVLTK
jgi:hypothetical protein